MKAIWKNLHVILIIAQPAGGNEQTVNKNNEMGKQHEYSQASYL